MHPAPSAPVSEHSRARLARALTRGVWALLGAGALAALALAAWLEPDARGFGTHEQLGLAPCGFAAVTGLPCPGCGLTTSFARMAHAQPIAAFAAHAMGPPLFVLVCALACYAPYAVVRGRALGAPLAAPGALAILVGTALTGVGTAVGRLAQAFWPH